MNYYAQQNKIDPLIIHILLDPRVQQFRKN